MSPTGAVEWMAAIAGCGFRPVLWQISELNTVISQSCVVFAGDNFGQGVYEGCGCHCIGAIDGLDISELRCPIDGDIKVELACGCADFRQADMKVANGLVFKLLPSWLVAAYIGQTTNAVALKTAM
jgi:hypothetical protein